MGTVTNVSSISELEAALSANRGHAVVNLWAKWAEPCKQMNEVFDTLASLYGGAAPLPQFLSADVDESNGIIDRYNVASVPAFLFFSGISGTEMGRVEGADAPSLTLAVTKMVDGSMENEARAKAPENEQDRLRKLVSRDEVMLFMKGSPETPRCGFSRQIVGILKEQDISFSHFDILEDQTVRTGLKTLSDWPTFPQLYVAGQFIGGLDVVKELVNEDALADEFDAAKKSAATKQEKTVDAAPSELTEQKLQTNSDQVENEQERLQKLIRQKPVMLFMKGSPESPRCGFSSKIIDILKKERVDFGYFDILTDMDVRAGLKKLSNWPTYPQLYAKGELIGGLDIVRELHEDKALLAELGF